MVTRVVVINDTGASRHFGCDAVMKTLRREIEQRRGVITYAHPVSRDWRASDIARAAIDAADLIVVNGEGTIHHDNDAATALVSIGPYAAERRRRAVLINATIEGNGPETMRAIGRFDGVWARDSASQRALAASGVHAGLVPDLSFGEPLEPATGGRGPIIIDSVVSRDRRRLARLADRMGKDYFSLRHTPGPAFVKLQIPGVISRNSYRRRGNRLQFENVTAFAKFLGQHDYMIAGRYHAVTLALAIGLPFSAVASNTSKIESLLADVGLNPARMVKSDADFASPLLFSAEEKALIAAYLTKAARSRQIMFDELVGEIQLAA